jgi:diacylglycerol kinase (ATP)
MANQSQQGLRRLLNAARYSYDGLLACWRNEEAFRQELVACLIAIPLAFWLGENGVEWALLIASLMLLLIVELLNSAIEAAIDRISLERHELSKRAKDLASAAVSLAVLQVLVVWLLVLAG